MTLAPGHHCVAHVGKDSGHHNFDHANVAGGIVFGRHKSSTLAGWAGLALGNYNVAHANVTGGAGFGQHSVAHGGIGSNHCKIAHAKRDSWLGEHDRLQQVQSQPTRTKLQQLQPQQH